MAAAESTATAMVAAIATGALIGILPKIADVRRSGPSDEIAADLHTALVVGGAVVFSLGAVASFTTRDPIPLMVAVILITTVIVGYEWTLHSNGVILK